MKRMNMVKYYTDKISACWYYDCQQLWHHLTTTTHSCCPEYRLVFLWFQFFLYCFFKNTTSISHLDSGGCPWVLALLLSGFAMAEKHQPIGLCGPEVKRDGSCLLRRPLAQCHERLWGVKGHGIQRGHNLTLEGHHPTYLQHIQEKKVLMIAGNWKCGLYHQDQNGSFVAWDFNKFSCFQLWKTKFCPKSLQYKSHWVWQEVMIQNGVGVICTRG